MILELTDQ
jgi:superfamily II DNA helicase RecQ